MAKNYSFNKAKAIIAQHQGNIQSAYLGMKEDWSWTAESIYEDGKCTLPDTDTGEIAGIGGSQWATPVLEITLLDDTEVTMDCYSDTETTASEEDIQAMKTFAKLTGGMDSL